MVILTVDNLTKKFKDFLAVDDVSFELKEGEILGLLGPNGAGKTTTIQMLLGILTPTSGSVSYFGKDLKKHREEILEKVNFSSTYTTLPWLLTVKECLYFLSYLYQISDRKKRISEIIEIFRLEELLNEKIQTLSSGQLTRVNLAKALINSPRVLLLDEPTASLDPDTAAYIRDFLQLEQKNSQISIILTSHNMSEVEELCQRVVFINHGKIIADDTPRNLAKSINVSHLELRIERKIDELVKYCTAKKFVHRIKGNYITIDIDEHKIALILQELSDKNLEYSEISIEKPSLEDFFLEKTTGVKDEL
ncbi:MAG TPA: ABC transporter ATP-binding protein [Patescibacteria group bacterium]|nr:ABC transporter ATP-binding protein [Patescibacteria group bacterium]